MAVFWFCPGSSSNGYKSFVKMDDGNVRLRISKDDAAKFASLAEAFAAGIKALRLTGMVVAEEPEFVDAWDCYEAHLVVGQ